MNAMKEPWITGHTWTRPDLLSVFSYNTLHADDSVPSPSETIVVSVIPISGRTVYPADPTPLISVRFVESQWRSVAAEAMNEFRQGRWAQSRLLQNLVPRFAYIPIALAASSAETDPSYEPPTEMTKRLMSMLVTSPSRHINSLLAEICQSSTPSIVLNVALREYSRTWRKEYLEHAAAVLERFGASAWPVLLAFAYSRRPECFFFVQTIISLKGAPIHERMRALCELAHNPDLDVRSQLMMALADTSFELRQKVLEVFATDPDSEIRDEAEWQLRSTVTS